MGLNGPSSVDLNYIFYFVLDHLLSRLTVGGTHMDVFRPFSTDSLLAEEWKEEVFDQEGCVEEILAFDPRSGSVFYKSLSYKMNVTV